MPQEKLFFNDTYTISVDERYTEFVDVAAGSETFGVEKYYSTKTNDTTKPYLVVESIEEKGTNDEIYCKFVNYTAVAPSSAEREIRESVSYYVTVTDTTGPVYSADTAGFATTTNTTYAPGSNGALAVIQDYRVSTEERPYGTSVVTAPSAEELHDYLASSSKYVKVVFSVIGEFERDIRGTQKSYVFNRGQTLTINDSITSYIPDRSNCSFSVLTDSNQPDLGAMITGQGCDLSVGSFTFYRPRNDSVGYSVIVRGDVNYSKEDAEITYKDYENDVTLGVNIPGFVAGLNSVRVKGDRISFSGGLKILEPFTLAEIDLEKLEFSYHDGDVSVLGLIASGYAGLGNLPFAFPIGADASVSIDTYKTEFAFDINIDLYFFATEARLSMIPLNSGVIFPDEIYFSVEVHPGIVIVPVTPVITLNGGGGGISDIATSFNGSFDGIPPIAIEYFGTATIMEMISGSVGVKIGLGSFYLFGEELTILEQEIIDYLGIGFELKYGDKVIGGQTYCGFTLSGYGVARFEITPEVPIIVVTGSVSLGVTVGRNVDDSTDSILSLGFNGSLRGTLQIPKLGGFGPFEIVSGEVYLSLDANVHFNTETPDIQGLFKRVSGNGKVGVGVSILIWSVKVEYTFGASAPEVYVTKAIGRSNVPTVKYTENLYDEDGNYEGTVTVGNNIEFVSQSADRSSTKGRVFSLMSSLAPSVTTALEKSKVHTVSMPTGLTEAEARNYGYILEEQSATPTTNPLDFVKNMTVSKPNGDNYQLKALPYAETYTQEQLNDKSYNLMYTVDAYGVRSWYLSLPGDPGTWTIRTSEDCALSILKFNPLPELATAVRTGNTVAFTTSNIAADVQSKYEVRAYLGKEDDGELGTLVGKGAITDGAGSLTLSVTDETLSSGDYYLKLSLYKLGEESLDVEGKTIPAVDELLDILTLEGLYSHTNPKAPIDVQGVWGQAIGNGLLNIGFRKPDETSVSSDRKIKGYAVKLYERTGGTGSVEDPYVYADTDFIFDVPADDTVGIKDITFKATGVSAGKTYRVSVAPYSQITYTVDSNSETLNIYGNEISTESANDVELPVPVDMYINAGVEGGYVKHATQASAELVIGSTTDKIGFGTNEGATLTVSCLKTTYDSENKATSEYVTVASTYDSATKMHYVALADIKTALGLGSKELDGSFSLSVKSENAAKDFTTLYCSVTLDKTPPKLTVTSSSVTVNGNYYRISGTTEAGLTVTDSYGNNVVSDANNGSFVIRGELSSEKLAAITDTSRIGIFAADKAGNSAVVEVSVKKRELNVGGVDILTAGTLENGVYTYTYTGENSGTVVFDPQTDTLTLSGLGLADMTENRISTNADLTLNLVGTNKIFGSTNEINPTINVKGNLTVTGENAGVLTTYTQYTHSSGNADTLRATFIHTDGKLVMKSGKIEINAQTRESFGIKPIIDVTGDFYQYGGEIVLKKFGACLGKYYAIKTGNAKLYGGRIELSYTFGGMLINGEMAISGGSVDITSTDLPALLAYRNSSEAIEAFIDIDGISEVKVPDIYKKVAELEGTYFTTFSTDSGSIPLPYDFIDKHYNEPLTYVVKSLEIGTMELKSKIDSASVTLGGDLTVNFYATVYETEKTVQMRFTMNGGSMLVDGIRDGGTLIYQFPFTKIAPQFIGDNIKAELLIDNVVVDTVEEYSIKTYCTNQLSKTAAQLGLSDAKHAAFKTLLADLLEYGAQAQKYMNYKTETLVNSGITGQSSFVTLTSGDKAVSAVTPNTNNQKFTFASLWFNNVNRLQFKFTADDVSNVKVRIKRGSGSFVDATFTPVSGSANTYVVSTDDILATGFDDIYSLELLNGSTCIQTLKYSVKSYIYAMQNNSANVDMANLAKATYNYGLSANAYNTAV